MDTHTKLAAVFHIVLGAMGLIGAFVVFAVFATAGGIAASQGGQGAGAIIGIVALCIGGLITLLSVPGIIGGLGLLAGKSWARVLLIVVGALDLLHFPLGTALGIYTLWALLRSDQPRLSAPPGNLHPIN